MTNHRVNPPPPHILDRDRHMLLDALVDAPCTFTDTAALDAGPVPCSTVSTDEVPDDEAVSTIRIWARTPVIDVLRVLAECRPSKAVRRALSEFGPTIGTGALTNRRTRW